MKNKITRAGNCVNFSVIKATRRQTWYLERRVRRITTRVTIEYKWNPMLCVEMRILSFFKWNMCLFTWPTGVLLCFCSKERRNRVSLLQSHFPFKDFLKGTSGIISHYRSHTSDRKISRLELHEFLSINFIWKMSRQSFSWPSVNRARFTP